MLNKKCNVCLKELDIENFSVNKATKDGYENKCKPCLSEIRKSKRVKVPRVKYDVNRTEKPCKGCGKVLDLSFFDKNNITADGYENKCHTCRKEQRARSAQEKQKRISQGEIIITEKKCTMCKLQLPIDRFNKDSSRGDGFDAKCRDCMKIHYSEYYFKPENKQKVINKSILWRKNNLEHIKNTSKKYYFINKDNINSRISKYKLTDHGRYIQIKAGANSRGIKFSLSEEFVNSFKDKDCIYCGNKLDKPRIDRVNSSIGYVENNCVPCCTTCNYMKNTLDVKDFIIHIRKILKVMLNDIDNDIDIKKSIGSFKSKQINHISRGAKNRGIEYSLTNKLIDSLHDSVCEYCDAELDMLRLDRIDSSLGYIDSNVVPCCPTCNNMKGTMSLDQFHNKCIDISNHYKSKYIDGTKDLDWLLTSIGFYNEPKAPKCYYFSRDDSYALFVEKKNKLSLYDIFENNFLSIFDIWEYFSYNERRLIIHNLDLF